MSDTLTLPPAAQLPRAIRITAERILLINQKTGATFIAKIQEEPIEIFPNGQSAEFKIRIFDNSGNLIATELSNVLLNLTNQGFFDAVNGKPLNLLSASFPILGNISTNVQVENGTIKSTLPLGLTSNNVFFSSQSQSKDTERASWGASGNSIVVSPCFLPCDNDDY